MNKLELISSISIKSNLTKKDSGKLLNALIESVEETLEKKEKVLIISFGTFEIRTRAARIGRNPRTSEEISIPETTVPIFKAGKELRDKVKK